MSWNTVLNKFIEIKKKFTEKFGEDSLWDYKDITCIEYWVEKLENKEYENMISCLKFTEFNDMLMFHYYYLERAVKNGIVKSVEDLWNVYDGFYSECRSVVINIKENELVLTPFKKFHNINAVSWTKEDVIAEKIKQAKNVEISTKLDGSMQSARWYKGKVVVAGSQGIDRKKAYRIDCSYQIIESNENYKQMLQDYNEYTAIFEYIFLNDVHVVKYNKEEEGLYLIGMRRYALIDKYTNHVNHYISVLQKYDLSKKEAMLWIRRNVPKMYESYVRETYLGKECNFIKNRNGKYLKLNEIEALL